MVKKRGIKMRVISEHCKKDHSKSCQNFAENINRKTQGTVQQYYIVDTFLFSVNEEAAITILHRIHGNFSSSYGTVHKLRHIRWMG